MKKSNLKEGMMIECRNGDLGLIVSIEDKLKVVGILIKMVKYGDRQKCYWGPVGEFNEDLTVGSSLREYDIVKVYSEGDLHDWVNFDVSKRVLLWERNDKKVTLNKNYFAEVKENKVIVGCQEFDFEVIEKLHNVIQTVKNSNK